MIDRSNQEITNVYSHVHDVSLSGPKSKIQKVNNGHIENRLIGDSGKEMGNLVP